MALTTLNNKHFYILLTLVILFSFTKSTMASGYNYATILQYHHVNTDTPSVTSVSPEVFQQHLQLIKDEGFTVMPLDLIINNIKLGIKFEQKTIAITFDDNYRSIYDNAFPLLKASGLPFTVFVNPKGIKNSDTSVNADFILSWDQLNEMKNNGAIIANHTQNHLHLLDKLAGEDQSQWQLRIHNEISAAQQQLIDNLGDAPKWLAYPYGEFNESLKTLINDMGYLGFSQQSGGINHTTDWQSIPRFPASGIYANLKTLKTKINSLPFEVLSISPPNIIRKLGDTAPSMELIVNKQGVNHKQLTCFFSGNRIYSETQVHGDHLIIQAQYEGRLPFGRSRYNCTAPAKSGGFYWYSMPFVTSNDQGQWQD